MTKIVSVHAFRGGSDGSHPRAAPLMSATGTLYGTTAEGGGDNDGGVVFEVKPNGREKIVYAFTGNDDGGGPFAGLIADRTGSLRDRARCFSGETARPLVSCLTLV